MPQHFLIPSLGISYAYVRTLIAIAGILRGQRNLPFAKVFWLFISVFGTCAIGHSLMVLAPGYTPWWDWVTLPASLLPAELLARNVEPIRETLQERQDLGQDLSHVIASSTGPVFTALLRAHPVTGEPAYAGGDLERWAEYFGLESAELIGRSHYEVFSPTGHSKDTVIPKAWQQEHQGVMLHGKSYQSGTLEFELADGTLRHFRYSIGPLPKRQGRYGMVFYVIDECDRVKLTQELQQKNQELECYAHTDHLTGLWNRRWMFEQMADKVRQGYWVLALDLDGFKLVNDTYEHQVGDRVLRTAAQRIQAVVAEQCLDGGAVGRIGGDEFAVVVCPDEDPEEVARLIVEAIEQPIDTGQSREPAFISVSVGIGIQDSSQSGREAWSRADIAMYAAKRQGKAQGRRGQISRLTPEVLAKHQAEQSLAADLRRAIARQELVLYYQPVKSLGTSDAEDALAGVEALVRWPHPTLGLLLPGQFLPVAEREGLMQDVTRLVVQEVIRQKQAWFDATGKKLPVSVNIPPAQIERGFLRQLFKEIGVSSSDDIQLEVLELAFERLKTGFQEIEQILRHLNLLIWLDDFGTGYSQIETLEGLEQVLAGIKIDITLTRLAASRPAVIRHVAAIAREYGLSVTAEGVEPYRGVDLLQKMRECGVKRAQGFDPRLGRPMPGDAIERLLLEQG